MTAAALLAAARGELARVPDVLDRLLGGLDEAAWRARPAPAEWAPAETLLNEMPSPTNPLGVKAGGEGGTTPAPAVIASAIADALAPLGVRDIPMPATPAAIWRGIQEARG